MNWNQESPAGDYCAFFPTEDEAMDHCRLVNRAVLEYLNEHPTGLKFETECVVVIDGPDDNYAVVDIESAKEILDWPESGIPYLVVTD